MEPLEEIVERLVKDNVGRKPDVIKIYIKAVLSVNRREPQALVPL